VASVRAALAAELTASGLDPREVRWLTEEFLVGDDPDAATALREAAERRRRGEPLQYVIGHWPFRTLDLDLDHRALIPRPETEGVVDVALGELARSGAAAPLIVDLGCGSGAIGLALLAELRDRGVTATLLAIDRDHDALALAARNALKHGLSYVTFVHSSWFDDVDPSFLGRIDLVVANPPYVGAEELEHLDPVLAYEPRGALVAGDAGGVAGFADVAQVIVASRPWLNENGALVVEHGAGQGRAAVEAARAAGYVDVRDERDLAGRDRVVVARA